MMSNTRRNIRLGIFLNIGIGIVFLIAAVIAVISVNYGMRRQALTEAESKARIILDRNLATHTYFTKIMKPEIFKWTESFRTKEHFDPTWMSSTFAIREIEKYFRSFNPAGYFFKDAALDARSPENEAEGYERLFLEKINADKKLETESSVRRIDGKPFLVVLRRGEVMEASCLKCHANPKDAPKGLIDFYGSERSFNRKVGDAVSAVSLRIPLAEAYAGADIFSLRFSIFLIVVLAGLFTTQYWFYRRYLLKPLHVMQEKATQITKHDEHLGDQIPQPFGRELGQLTTAFNEMSVKLHHDRNHLEDLVEQRTAELKLANEQFRRERDFSKSLINTAQVILLVLDTEGRIVNFNPYLEEISGYTLEEVEGRDWFSIFLPESDRQRGREFFLKAVDNFQTKGNVDPILTKDGRLREIEWYDKTLKDAEGRVIGLLVIGQDITERKQAEEALRHQKEMLQVIFDSVPVMIAFLDPEGHHQLVNRCWQSTLGWSLEEAMYKDVLAELYPDPAYREYVLDYIKRSAGRWGDFKTRSRDGRVLDTSWINVSLWDGSNIGIGIDITERKRAEEEIKRSLVEKEILLKEVHHRVKNNLQIISSMLNLQSRSVKDKETVQILREGQDRVKSMVLIHEKVYQSRDLEKVNFNEYLQNLTANLFRSYGVSQRMVGLKLNIENILLTLDKAIPCGLIVNELVSNVLKHAFPVKGESDSEEKSRGEIRIDLRSEKNNELTLVVGDNGIGFPRDLDFRDTESLGLQVVNTLVGQLEGSIELRREGRTEFEIRFKV